MRRYARQMWLTDTIDIVLMTRIELALLGLMLTSGDMGYFAAAAVFSSLVTQFALQLSPAFVVGFSTEEASARAALFDKAMRFTALAVLPVAFGGAAVAPQLLPLVFGEAFAPAAPAAAVLLAASAFSGLAVVPWAFLAATGGSGSLLRIMAGSAGLTIGLLAAAIALAGLNGAALARLLIEALTLALLIAALRRAAGPALPAGALLRTGLAAGLSALAALAVQQWLAGWTALAAAIPAGAIAYTVGLRLLHLVDGAEAEALLASGPVRRLPPALWHSLSAILGLLITKK